LKAGAVLARTLLDQALVLFRGADGRVAALHDVCPHRLVPLSLGQVCEGNRLRCAYHGLEFDSSGACVRNPNAEGRIPAKARVRSFPVAEKHGAVWIWMGEGQADPAGIPDFSLFEQSDPALTMPRRRSSVEANYELMTYNIMDLTHVNTLHAGILGNEDSFRFEISAEESGDTLWLYRRMPSVRPMRVNQLMFRKDIERVDQWAHMRWNAPGCILNDAGVCPPGQSIEQGTGLWGIHFLTPESERRTHYFFCAILRNPMVRTAQEEAEIQQEMNELRRIAFDEQDKKVLEAQQRTVDKAGGMAALQQQAVPLSTDAATLRFRRILDRLREAERNERSAA
jgi:phenylpropionate dioxygenase-like ring-hydroxylating dioxygenase large terminal subunit